jgi:hypothetical protein
MTRSDFNAEEDGERPSLVQWWPNHRRGEVQVISPKAAVAVAIGAAAVGALAVGALAVGAMAIGRLAVGKARFRKLQVDELTIGSLRVLRP